MSIFSLATLFILFLFIVKFNKKILLVMILEMLMMTLLFKTYSQMMEVMSSYVYLLFIMCVMVMDSVFSLSLMIASTRMSGNLKFDLKNL